VLYTFLTLNAFFNKTVIDISIYLKLFIIFRWLMSDELKLVCDDVIVSTPRILPRCLRGEKPRNGSIVTHFVQVDNQTAYLLHPSRNRYSLSKLPRLCTFLLKACILCNHSRFVSKRVWNQQMMIIKSIFISDGGTS
jgi:hypothetical protein